VNSWLSRLLWFLGISVVLVSVVTCGTNSSSKTNSSQIPTVTVTVNNSSITAGQSVTLTWTSTNATSITITPSVGQSPLPLSGSVSLSPTANTTYTAVAAGAGGTAQKTVTVSVTGTPLVLPTVSFTATPTSVMVGSLVTFTWVTTNATTFSVTPSIQAEDDIGMALSGTTTIVASSTQTYVATAIGPGGTVTQSVTVTLTGPAPAFTTLTATPSSIAAGQSSTLQWSTSNAQYVTISGISQQFQPSDQVSVSPTTTTNYTATATGPSGTATQTVAVKVVPVSVTLSAAPATIAPGQSSTLTWTTVGATSVIINGVAGTQSPNGSVAVTPAQTTTFTATASDGNGNSAISTATVTVFTGTGNLSAIKHIIFMMQENRSFDNYFGKLGAYRAGKVSGASPSDVNDLDQLQPALANGIKTRTDAPHPNMLIPPFHERTLQTEDLSPSWNESHYAAHLIGNYLNVTSSSTFKMDYFLQTTHSVSPDLYDPDGTRPIGYYDQTDLPYYYELATQFATSDSFHSSLLTQTNPNRMFLFAATALGRCNADPTGHAPWQTRTIFDELLDAGVSWRYYYQDGVFLAQFADWSNPKIQSNVYNVNNLFTVLSQPNADSQLPSVIFIERGTKTDEHPDNNIQAGATVVKSVLDALMASSAWNDSIFIFTYDEGGGLFDHVPPFMVTPPGDMDPKCPSNLTPGLYNLSGFRVPMIAISPYSKPHYVSHTPMENTSILKLIETRFNLPALTQRDANAPDMTEFFDFSNPYWLTPPPLPAQPNECLTNSSRCSQKLETYPNLP
jgi:phospholipase C